MILVPFAEDPPPKKLSEQRITGWVELAHLESFLRLYKPPATDKCPMNKSQ